MFATVGPMLRQDTHRTTWWVSTLLNCEKGKHSFTRCRKDIRVAGRCTRKATLTYILIAQSIGGKHIRQAPLLIVPNPYTMHTSTLLLALAAFVLRCVHAELHSDGVCFDNVGGQNVYNGAATTAACASYLQRNTGGEQWDSCPDCAIVSSVYDIGRQLVLES